MTKLTTQGEKDSANTDLPQFHDPDDPDDQVIGLDTEDTVPPDETHIQNDPEPETIEIDPSAPRRPPSSPTSPTHDATSSKHSPSPPSATCNARNGSGPNPKTT